MHDWHSEVRARLAPLNLKPEREADIVDEIAQHLAERYRDSISAGASPDEATRLTLAELRASNMLAQRIAVLRQAHAQHADRGSRQFTWLDDLARDARHAWRALCTGHGLPLAAVATLALAIGTSIAMFSVLDAV